LYSAAHRNTTRDAKCNHGIGSRFQTELGRDPGSIPCAVRSSTYLRSALASNLFLSFCARHVPISCPPRNPARGCVAVHSTRGCLHRATPPRSSQQLHQTRSPGTWQRTVGPSAAVGPCPHRDERRIACAGALVQGTELTWLSRAAVTQRELSRCSQGGAAPQCKFITSGW